MLEVNGRWLRALVDPDGSCVEGIAVQVPCSFSSASSAGGAKAETSPVPRINQHIAEVRRCMTFFREDE
jgi:hypothetical protein